jgi:DNA invertase Pin-like site-specific DNA recombinase
MGDVSSMRVVAYLYHEPLLDKPEPTQWGQSVERVYEDWGDRQQLLALLTDCQQDPPDCLLIRQISELGDTVEDVGDRLQLLEQAEVTLIPLHAPVGQEGAAIQRSDVIRLFQELQRTQRSRQIQKGHARNRLKALPPPGRAPYGYRRSPEKYVIDRTAAPVVKAFFEDFLLYGSLRGSVRFLAKQYGKKISVSTAQHWLTSPVYRGDLMYRQGEVILNTHTPIISREEAAQVERLLRRNRSLAPRAASARRSLAGLVTCETCQSPMTITRVTARRRDREYLYVRPIACQRPQCGLSKCAALPYAQVLEQTIERICEDLPNAVAGLTLPDLEQVKQRLAAQMAEKQAIVEQLPALVATGVLDAETADLRRYKVQTELADLQNRLAQLPPVNLRAIAQAVSIPQFWFDLSEAERRFYFREFIRQIQVIRDEESQTWRLQLVFVF